MYVTIFCARENGSVFYGKKEKMIRRKLNGMVLWKSLDWTKRSSQLEKVFVGGGSVGGLNFRNDNINITVADIHD
jgi:hypothetical protein